MKIVISSSALRKAVITSGKLIPSKPVIPILSHLFFLFSGENELTVVGSDGGDALSLVVPVLEASDVFSVCLPFLDLKKMLDLIPEQPIAIHVDKDSLNAKIIYANGEYNFVGLSSDEYPNVNSLSEDGFRCETNAGELLDAFSRLSPFMGNDELRPTMNGLYFDVQPDLFVLAATDGHKLIKHTLAHASADGPRSGFIVPRSAISLMKTFRGGGNIYIRTDSRHIEFRGDGYALVCRQLEGRYPNYEAVFPKDSPVTVRVDRNVIVPAIRRAFVTSPESNLVKITFSVEQNEAVVHSENIEYIMGCEERVDVEIEGLSKERTFGFKADYLLCVLEAMKDHDITIELAEPNRAAVFHGTAGDGTPIALLMPMAC